MSTASPQTSSWWMDRIIGDPSISKLLELVAEGGEVSARGVAGSSTTMLVAAIARNAPGPVVMVVPHLDDADEVVEELIDLGVEAASFPALEVMPGEREPSVDLVSARLGLVRSSLESGLPPVVVAPFPALMQGVPPVADLQDRLRMVRRGWQRTKGWHQQSDKVVHRGRSFGCKLSTLCREAVM